MTPTTQVTQPVRQGHGWPNSPHQITPATSPPGLACGQPTAMAPPPPTVSTGAWAFTRQAFGSSQGVSTHDIHNVPVSAGVSEASVAQPVASSQAAWAGGASMAGASHASGVANPLATACPALGLPTNPLLQAQPIDSPQDESIRRTRSPLPKLVIKGGDATVITRTVNEWIQKTSIALNTWSLQASTFWTQTVQLARQQHNWWLSLSPAQRATYVGLPTTGQTIPLQIPVLEATVRAELLNAVLPDRVVSAAMQKGTLTVLDLLFLTFQTYLPSEPSARVDGLALVESPLKAARSFGEALSTLRTWRQQILTVVNDLQGNPEPLKLFQSLKMLISSLISSDNAFATEVSQMLHQTNIKTICTDQTLLTLMSMLEIELSARAHEDDEDRRRRGQANLSSGNQAVAAAVGKGKGGKGGKSKGKGKGKGGKGDKGKGTGSGGASPQQQSQTPKRPVCQDYMTDRGCARGDQCTNLHPRRTGKCLRCGATNHDLSTCRRPGRDNAARNAAAKSSPQPKAKNNPKAKPRAKSQPARARGGANVAWATENTTVTVEEVRDQPDVEMSAAACSFYTTYLPTYHTASSAAGDDKDHPENLPILDTGATHCLLPLDWLSAEECEEAKRIHLKVATGTTVRALLSNNVIYAKTVSRPLVSVGQLKQMLDLRFIWDDASPQLLLCHAGKKFVLLRARVVHHLPVISRKELTCILGAISECTSQGEIWNLQRWNAEMAVQLDEFHWSPLDASMHVSVTDEAVNPQMHFSALENNTLLDENLPTRAVKVFNLEDCDAKTEPLGDEDLQDRNAEEEKSAMTTSEAIDILLNHALPKSRSRTNVSTKAYIPQGRLFGAFTTRGEGITQATYRYPEVVEAIHALASTRCPASEDEGYLAAQMNRAKSLPIHQDKNNHSHTWLIAFGDFDGGRLWIEDPLGDSPPPHADKPWQSKLRGSFHNVKNAWLKFDPRNYHALEEVTRGERTSIALFSPRSWTRLPPHALAELADVGFLPPRSINSISAMGTESRDLKNGSLDRTQVEKRKT